MPRRQWFILIAFILFLGVDLVILVWWYSRPTDKEPPPAVSVFINLGSAAGGFAGGGVGLGPALSGLAGIWRYGSSPTRGSGERSDDH